MFVLMKLLSIFIWFNYAAASVYPSVQLSAYAASPQGQCSRREPDFHLRIPLRKQPVYGNNEIFGGILPMNRSQILMVTFSHVNPNISFVIIQVHVFEYRVEIYKNSPARNSSLSGSHLGMYSDVEKNRDIFYITNYNCHVDVTFYLSVHGYGREDPIPGGCNLESPIPIAPYLIVNNKIHSNTIDAAPPMAPYDPECMTPKSTNANVVFYMMYLPENDFSRDTFYDGIRKMMSLNGIQKYGIVVPKTAWNMRRMISAYQGVGAVFSAVVTTPEGYAIYVPALTYSCYDRIVCTWSEHVITVSFSVVLALVSAFLCFLGQRHFIIELFIIAIVDAVILAGGVRPADESESLLLGILWAYFVGLTFALFWVTLWMMYEIPVTAVVLPALNFGAVIASIMYYRLPDDYAFLHSDFNYWSVFMLVTLLVTLGVVAMPYHGNLLCSSVLGSYGIIASIDLCMGGVMKYIVGNTLRRMFGINFNNAMLLPPFTDTEKALSTLWLVLATSGLVFQYYTTRNRPRFPVLTGNEYAAQILRGFLNGTGTARGNPTTTERTNERTPLLAHAN